MPSERHPRRVTLAYTLCVCLFFPLLIPFLFFPRHHHPSAGVATTFPFEAEAELKLEREKTAQAQRETAQAKAETAQVEQKLAALEGKLEQHGEIFDGLCVVVGDLALVKQAQDACKEEKARHEIAETMYEGVVTKYQHDIDEVQAQLRRTKSKLATSEAKLAATSGNLANANAILSHQNSHNAAFNEQVDEHGSRMEEYARNVHDKVWIHDTAC